MKRPTQGQVLVVVAIVLVVLAFEALAGFRLYVLG